MGKDFGLSIANVERSSFKIFSMTGFAIKIYIFLFVKISVRMLFIVEYCLYLLPVRYSVVSVKNRL